jgi:mono/diheme cytochrome c family protein
MPLHGFSRAGAPWALRALCAAFAALACLTGSLAYSEAAPTFQDPVTGEQVYKAKCAACHTIGGGKLVGPDLQGVTQQRDPAWLKQFIAAPDKVLASGDPLAAQLLAEYNNIPMPNLGLTAAEVDDILAYLAAQSAPPAEGAAPPAPAQPALPPLAGDAAQGQQLFTGQAALAGRGTPCIACHSVEGVGALGGGALGPDLTQVHTRYGAPGLAAALGSLPFPSMQSIYANKPLTPAEQADLLAFFARADQGPAPRTQRNLLVSLAAGAGLAGTLFLGMTLFWPRQRLSIAQRLRKNGRL